MPNIFETIRQSHAEEARKKEEKRLRELMDEEAKAAVEDENMRIMMLRGKVLSDSIVPQKARALAAFIHRNYYGDYNQNHYPLLSGQIHIPIDVELSAINDEDPQGIYGTEIQVYAHENGSITVGDIVLAPVDVNNEIRVEEALDYSYRNPVRLRTGSHFQPLVSNDW